MQPITDSSFFTIIYLVMDRDWAFTGSRKPVSTNQPTIKRKKDKDVCDKSLQFDLFSQSCPT